MPYAQFGLGYDLGYVQGGGLQSAGQSLPGAFSLVDGASGAMGGYPQALRSANSVFLGTTANTGIQSLYEIDATTGSVLNSLTASSAYSGLQDDHIEPTVIKTPAGALLMAYCGHNSDSVIRFRRSAAGTIAGFGTEYTLATSGPTTYPQIFTHASTGNLYLIYRSTLLQWQIAKSTDDGVSWTLLGSFVNNTQQMYCTGVMLGDNLRIFSNFNQSFSNAIIYIAELNVVTGALVSGSGTLCNMYTNSPAFPSDMTNWSSLIAPGAGLGAAIQDAANDGNLAYLVITNDQQYAQYWYAKFNGGNQFASANWTFSKVVDAGGGVGANRQNAGTATYRWSGFHCLADEPGLVYPRMYLSRRVRNVWYLERWDALNANGTAWKCSMFFDSQGIGISNQIGRPSKITNANSKLPFYYRQGQYLDYTSWTTALRWPIITQSAAGRPTITSSASFSTAEQKALEITLVVDRPAGWRISGGADAALFNVAGNKLYLEAKQYGAPADADADNVYQVQVTACDISGGESNQSIAVSVTQAAYAPSNMLQYTEQFDNAIWAKSFTTIAANTTDTTDPLGGNTADRITGTADSFTLYTQGTSKRVNQASLSIAVSTKYTISCYFKKGTGEYGQVDFYDGQKDFAGTFDLNRGIYLGDNVGTNNGALLSHGMQDAGNGWYRCWITFQTSSNAAATGTAQIAVKQPATSINSDITINAVTAYLWGAMMNAGDLGTYVQRTT